MRFRKHESSQTIPDDPCLWMNLIYLLSHWNLPQATCLFLLRWEVHNCSPSFPSISLCSAPSTLLLMKRVSPSLIPKSSNFENESNVSISSSWFPSTLPQWHLWIEYFLHSSTIPPLPLSTALINFEAWCWELTFCTLAGPSTWIERWVLL